MKRIATLVAESGDLRDLVIQPGTTSREILNQMGLNDRYTLSRQGGQAPFADDENVYELVSDGSKLVAATPVEVGG